MSLNDEIVGGFKKIAQELEKLEGVPESFVEIVHIALDDEAGPEDLEIAAELMPPSDLRAARWFCFLLRDSHAGDAALTRGLELLDAILSEAAPEREA
ncbi:MAG: hypothetical protein ACE5JR_13225 [Gemmatimonadota bacterium]